MDASSSSSLSKGSTSFVSSTQVDSPSNPTGQQNMSPVPKNYSPVQQSNFIYDSKGNPIGSKVVQQPLGTLVGGGSGGGGGFSSSNTSQTNGAVVSKDYTSSNASMVSAQQSVYVAPPKSATPSQGFQSGGASLPSQYNPNSNQYINVTGGVKNISTGQFVSKGGQLQGKNVGGFVNGDYFNPSQIAQANTINKQPVGSSYNNVSGGVINSATGLFTARGKALDVTEQRPITPNYSASGIGLSAQGGLFSDAKTPAGQYQVTYTSTPKDYTSVPQGFNSNTLLPSSTPIKNGQNILNLSSGFTPIGSDNSLLQASSAVTQQSKFDFYNQVMHPVGESLRNYGIAMQEKATGGTYGSIETLGSSDAKPYNPVAIESGVLVGGGIKVVGGIIDFPETFKRTESIPLYVGFGDSSKAPTINVPVEFITDVGAIALGVYSGLKPSSASSSLSFESNIVKYGGGSTLSSGAVNLGAFALGAGGKEAQVSVNDLISAGVVLGGVELGVSKTVRGISNPSESSLLSNLQRSGTSSTFTKVTSEDVIGVGGLTKTQVKGISENVFVGTVEPRQSFISSHSPRYIGESPEFNIVIKSKTAFHIDTLPSLKGKSLGGAETQLDFFTQNVKTGKLKPLDVSYLQKNYGITSVEDIGLSSTARKDLNSNQILIASDVKINKQGILSEQFKIGKNFYEQTGKLDENVFNSILTKRERVSVGIEGRQKIIGASKTFISPILTESGESITSSPLSVTKQGTKNLNGILFSTERTVTTSVETNKVQGSVSTSKNLRAILKSGTFDFPSAERALKNPTLSMKSLPSKELELKSLKVTNFGQGVKVTGIKIQEQVFNPEEYTRRISNGKYELVQPESISSNNAKILSSSDTGKVQSVFSKINLNPESEFIGPRVSSSNIFIIPALKFKTDVRSELSTSFKSNTLSGTKLKETTIGSTSEPTIQIQSLIGQSTFTSISPRQQIITSSSQDIVSSTQTNTPSSNITALVPPSIIGGSASLPKFNPFIFTSPFSGGNESASRGFGLLRDKKKSRYTSTLFAAAFNIRAKGKQSTKGLSGLGIRPLIGKTKNISGLKSKGIFDKNFLRHTRR